MPLLLTSAVRLLLVSATCAACAFYVFALVAAVRFFRGKTAVASSMRVPVSLLIPLHGAEVGAYENYAALCCQDYPDYQLVFGVGDPCDTAIPVVHQLMMDFAERDIALVVGPGMLGTNPKVSNLHNMLRCVKYEQIVMIDSDIRVGGDYLSTIVSLLNEARVGLVTCLYKAADAPDWAATLEALGITAEFVPGVLAAWLLEGMTFALGATMATTQTVLQTIGGFPAIGNHLADDFMLGHLIAQAGYEVRLVASHGATPSLLLLGTTLSLRLAMAWLIGVQGLHDRVLQKYIWLLPLRDLVGFGMWCLGLVGKHVEWRGQVFEIVDDGKIVKAL